MSKRRALLEPGVQEDRFPADFLNGSGGLVSAAKLDAFPRWRSAKAAV